MTDGESTDILSRVEILLGGRELQDQPRALLLLELCKFCMRLAPDKTERYWQLLQPLQSKLAPELQAEFKELRATLEESAAAGARGFTGEMLAEIRAATQATDAAETRHRLLDCEARLKKRLLPGGKGPVWVALVQAWIALDRAYALQLLKNAPGGLHKDLIAQMNRARTLAPEEWTTLAEGIGMGKVQQIAPAILGDEQQALRLPRAALTQVAKEFRAALQRLLVTNNQAEAARTIHLYDRLLQLHASGEAAELLPGLLEELFVYVAKDAPLDQVWLLRFTLLQGVIDNGVRLKTPAGAVMTPALIERLVSKTPGHLANFVRAECAGMTATAEQAETALAGLMARTNQDEKAEAWFLAALVRRGLGAQALALAAKSPRAQALLPRLRRAWLCGQPETAAAAIQAADMAGDPIGEFLAQGNAERRAAYLKAATQGGALGVPGAMWAGVGTEVEPEGLRGLWKKLVSHKTTEQVVVEYVARNPLYSSYRVDTKKENQFAETLRVNAYGDYRYQDVDAALLGALVSWGNQEPAQVKAVLRAMWNAIRPDDPILMVDWLRNSILARCVNVFAADAEVLAQDYLGWLKRELVDKGRQWQIGKQSITLRYPATVPLQFCVAAAATVGALSPSRRDAILLEGLGKYEANPALVESAAQLYNSDKTPLAIAPPLQLKPNLLPAWQAGIVKHALLAILQALAARAAGGA